MDLTVHSSYTKPEDFFYPATDLSPAAATASSNNHPHAFFAPNSERRMRETSSSCLDLLPAPSLPVFLRVVEGCTNSLSPPSELYSPGHSQCPVACKSKPTVPYSLHGNDTDVRGECD